MIKKIKKDNYYTYLNLTKQSKMWFKKENIKNKGKFVNKNKEKSMEKEQIDICLRKIYKCMTNSSDIKSIQRVSKFM